MANQFYENYRKKRNERIGNKEERERSFGEQLFPLYICLLIGMVIIHLFSFVCAVILPAYQIHLLTGSYALGIFLGLALVFCFVEVPKWICTTVSFENYWKDNEKSWGLIGTSIVVIILSVASSTNGVPIVFDWFAPEAAVVDLVGIEDKYSAKEEAALAHWTPLIEAKKQEKVDFFEQNKKFYPRENEGRGRWRVPRVGHLITKGNGIDAKIDEYQAELNKALKEVQEAQLVAISETKTANQAVKGEHTSKIDKAKIFSFWVMLLLEIVYIFSIAGVQYYKYRSKEEQTGLDQVQNKTEQPVRGEHKTEQPTQKNRTEQPKKQRAEQAQPAESKGATAKTEQQNPIGFNQHGKVFLPQGSTEPRVQYRTRKNTFTTYRICDLNRMIKKKSGSEEWKSELKKLRKKLVEFKA